MTKRINAKHKVDRRLNVIYGVDLKVHLTQGPILLASTDKIKEGSQQIMESSLTLNKN